MDSPIPSSPGGWTLQSWLGSIGCGDYYEEFVREDITPDVLCDLQRDDLRTLIGKVGDRLRIYAEICRIRQDPTWRVPETPRYPVVPKSPLKSPAKSPSVAPSTPSIHPSTPTATPHSTRSPNRLASLPMSLPDPEAVMLSFQLPDGRSITIPYEGSGTIIRERAMAKAGLSPTKFQILDAFDFIETDEQLWERAKETQEFEIWPVKEPDPFEPPTRVNSLRTLERPTSLHVSEHLSEFFPGVHPNELEKSIQQARQVVHRMSTISHKDPRRSRRMSSLLVTSPKRRMSSLNPILKAEPVVSSEDEQFLSQLDQEMKAPTKWERGRHLGSGSYGEVYMALNHFNFEFLAVKQVPLTGASRHHDAMIKSLTNEIELLSNLEHENIVQYRGYKFEGDFLNIFLEYVPGGSLANRNFNNGQPLTESLLKRILPQILTGLTYLHAKNIIHRDIKGANVLVADGLAVKISDFGVSKRVTTLHRNSIKGSPFWMAPEVVRGEPISTKADIWSLGCLVIEVMTGQHPFPDLNGDQAIFQIGNHSAPYIPTELSRDLQDFIRLALSVSPDERPEAAELLHHPFLL